MRVALVVPGGIDPSGRTRVIPALLWLIEELAARHEVDVHVLFHSSVPYRYDLAGARVFDLGLLHRHPPGLGFLDAIRAVRRSVESAGVPDVLHAFWAGTPGYAAGKAARALGVPMVLSLGGGELARIPQIGYGAQLSWRGRWPVRRSIRLADAVTAASAPMVALARAHGVDAERVPLGVRTELFEGLRGPDGPPFRLLHVADLNPVKDQTTLLLAFAEVLGRLPGTRLDVVGTDTMDGAIPRLAERLGVAEQVTFHGFLPTDAVVPLYAAAHLLVHASRHEAGPVVVLEAAAAGLPTVGTAVGHLVDLAPEAALAVPVGDAHALADGIVGLLRDPGRRRRMGDAARAFSRAHDASATARSFEEIYERLGGRIRSQT